MIALRPLAAAAALLATLPAAAQWSAVADLVVSDPAGEQVQPKLHADGTGGWYVTWFDNRTGGYDVYAQRLAGDGTPQWDANGTLVADRSFSSTQDYGADVMADGSLLIAYRDDSSGSAQIAATRLAPDGSETWTIDVTADGAFHASPRITATSDGGIVIAWSNDADVKLQRYDGTGTAQWGPGVTLTAAAGLLISDLQASNDGAVIISFVHGLSFSSPKHLHCQKFDSAGTAQWNGGSDVVVFDGGSLQIGNFPTFLSDGSGGAVFGWYETSPLSCAVQRILADGSESFAHNGVATSTNAVNNHVSPGIAYDAATERIFAFWTETDSIQADRGVSGQCIDDEGNRLWGDTGVTVVPLGGADHSFVNVGVVGDGAVVSWIESASFGNDMIRAARYDASGASVWAGAPIDVSAASADAGRLTMKSDGSSSVCVWQHASGAPADLHAQQIGADGALGPVDTGCAEDLANDDGVVGFDDLLVVISGWGTPAGDVDDDGTTGFSDLVAILAAWGPCA